MDQLKKALPVVKKHYFWALIGAAVLLVLALWFNATSGMAKDFKGKVAAKEGNFKSMKGIAQQPGYPNPEVVAAIEKKTKAQEQNVGEAWRTLYNDQRENNKLPAGLSDEFKRKYRALGPNEKLPAHLLEHYQNRVKEHLPKLYELVDLLRPKEGLPRDGGPGEAALPGGESDDLGPRTAPGPGRKPDRAAAEMIGLVDWAENDRKRLAERVEWPSPPTTFQVRLAQEDLWVYEALLTVIENANEGAQRHDQAYVKRIDALEIGGDAIFGRQGPDARPARGGVGPMATSGGVAGGEMDAFARPGPAPAPGPAAAPGGGVEPGAAAPAGLSPQETALLNGRYVDDKLNPVVPGAKHPYEEFKMMPVRMKVLIDQRRIARLLTECANSTMPIEVRQIRLRPDQGKSIDFGGAAAGGAQPGAAHGGFLGFGGAAAHRPAARESGSEGSSTSYDLPVEIRGIIYIYSPPKVGSDKAVETPAAKAPEAGPPAPPADGTAKPEADAAKAGEKDAPPAPEAGKVAEKEKAQP